MQLICPAGSLPSLKAAVDNGADAVYIGFQDDTNARHFPGLNFTDRLAESGIAYAHQRKAGVYVAINTYPQQQARSRWREAVDRAAGIGASALILADIGLLDYASRKYPALALHLSVQASATNHEALRFYASRFGIRRAVLPRVLSLQQVQRLAEQTEVPLEVFGFGSLCIMAEGRCHLSSYATGASPNKDGVCSPARAVRWDVHADGSAEARLSGVLINRCSSTERRAYPTLCKGRFDLGGSVFHALEEPTSLNALELLPALHEAGVCAIKIEGRQRSPAYVTEVTRIWRRAIDAVTKSPATYRIDAHWRSTLSQLSEGSQTTLGAYHRPWQ